MHVCCGISTTNSRRSIVWATVWIGGGAMITRPGPYMPWNRPQEEHEEARGDGNDDRDDRGIDGRPHAREGWPKRREQDHEPEQQRDDASDGQEAVRR